jgi:aminoglycoside phosphotransferase family enzyme/predicted kinase
MEARSGDPIGTALLRADAYPHPAEGVEEKATHISRVFLAGKFAYKLKRPVSLGFVDFSTLARRRFFCEEELRLNRRLAPQLYIGVVPVTRDGARIQVEGEGETVDFAVKMRRFRQRDLLSRRPLTGELIDRLAERVASFHSSLAGAPPESPYGEPDAVLAPMLDNFGPVHEALAGAGRDDVAHLRTLAHLDRWTRKHFDQLRNSLEERRRAGFIRECHGDMHRGNIVVIDAEPVIFDCIEFNPGLRWIDTMSEVAFLTMDLAEAGEHALSRRLLNRYLEVTGDYGGLRLLRLYQVYRALVRAKVSAIQLRQASGKGPDLVRHKADLGRYLELALACSARHRPRLFITHGLSGSGKTWLGHLLREHLPVIQLRSDIERKRLFGVPERARHVLAQGQRLYGVEATQRTYRRLLALSNELIASGFSVLVDATFLTREQRAPFLALARALGCSCRVLVLQAPMHVLRERISARNHAGLDASDADFDVLGLQIARREPLTDEEHRQALFLDTERPPQVEALLERISATDAPR